MINNKKQYSVTLKRIKEFEEIKTQLEKEDIHPMLKEYQLKMIDSQIEDFNNEIVEYKALCEKRIQSIKLYNFDQFGELLIKSRIANGLTHAELGKRIGMPEQQVQRNESTNYMSVKYSTMTEIARALGIYVNSANIQIVEKKFEFSDEVIELVANAKPKLNACKSLFHF